MRAPWESRPGEPGSICQADLGDRRSADMISSIILGTIGRSVMRKFLTTVVIIIFAGAVVMVTGAAQAGTGQCYDRNGRPIGPTYDTDKPNAAFSQWVTGRGGRCRRISDRFFGSNNRPYPQAYLNRGRGRSGSQGRGRPGRRGDIGCSRADLARLAPNINPNRAERLVARHYRREGLGQVRVRSRGLIIYVQGRLWHYLRVRGAGGIRHQVALRQTRQGGYIARVNSGSGWGARRLIRRR